jgi:Na+-transporting methylmalonyl-CoA/oxaloacetate decarboxylase gamma subunit
MGKSNEKKRDFFWLSYSDLMTSLFFVMLVLFVLVYSMQNKLISDLERNNETLTAAKEELDRIKEIQKTVDNIDKNYFQYDSINKKHILNMSFLFPKGNKDISKIVPDKRDDLLKAGKAIKTLVLRYPEEENNIWLL